IDFGQDDIIRASARFPLHQHDLLLAKLKPATTSIRFRAIRAAFNWAVEKLDFEKNCICIV
ncbi:hypothetical protein KKA08_03160, partial [bacterium]|nr:hypothetical protein [bacterium]